MRHKMMGWVLNLLNEMGIPLKDGCNGITCRGVFTFRIVGDAEAQRAAQEWDWVELGAPHDWDSFESQHHGGGDD